MYKVIVVLAVLVAAVYSRPDDAKYTTKFDNTNVDEILSNERLLIPYLKCLCNEGPCTPDAKEIKGSLADALQTACSKCSDKQKEAVEKVLRHLVEKKKQWFDKLGEIYDKDGVYYNKYKEQAKEKGINL